jgi:toxin ParE1/3/4
MSFILTKAAETDLENIWVYSQQTWSIQKADSYVQAIMKTLLVLSQRPDLGANRSSIQENYMSYKINSHIVFYRINREVQRVEVLRILHERMDYSQHL